ncbi:MAG TPA: hypothetical protein VG797_04265, partial [Phycisphaerales bacterium]|nr:hypothetical protein [Phycisphaerales bacterium]
AMLNKGELHLTKLSELEDPFEGVHPPKVRATMTKLMQRGSPIQLESELMRATTYVSCWCMQPHESEALWRIYGGSSGVAVRTRYSRLANVLPSNTPYGSVFMGQIQYLNPETADTPMWNALSLPMWKRHFFQHEQECRVVVWGAARKGHNTRLGNAQEWPSSMTIPIRVRGVIEDVVTSPLAPKWFHDCVKAVVDKFEPGLSISCSGML